jgi:predicted MFS family arabinose efflux permease
MSLPNPAATSCTAESSPAVGITGPLTLFFAIAVGVIVTNLFAPQTLIGLIGPSLGLDAAAGGLVPMATLLGYAAGLFLLVPLTDLLESRGLITRMLAGAACSACAAALAPTATPLLIILFVLGATCSAIQILVPIAASMAEPERRGRVIGDVMSGLMIGILLARPLASFIADRWGWRAFYGTSAVVMTILVIVLAMRLPKQPATVKSTYVKLIGSLWHLLRSEPKLQQRALTASLAMAAFSLFWTAVALRLSLAPFNLGQQGIAIFALVGVGGAAVTPIAGRLGDRGFTHSTTIVSHLVLIAAFVLAAWAGAVATGFSLPLALMAGSAILLDAGVTGDQTLGRRTVNLLRPEARGRLNAMFVGLFFVGGAIGSVAAGLAWAWGGWNAICILGAGCGLTGLIVDWRWKCE